MAENNLAPKSYQHIQQLGISRLIDASSGPDGPKGVVAYHLVPANGYHNGQRLPHDVHEDLKSQSYDTKTIEGIDYYLVPEVSTNTPGLLSHYAQRTGVAELQNAPSGGVNRVRETLTDYAHATVDPEGVSKYVDDNDSWEEARKKASEEDDRATRAVTVTPAREPAEGKLVVAGDDSSNGTSSPRRGRPPASASDPTTSE